MKNIKYLLSKCVASGQDCDQAVYEWRNVPSSDGYSPAQLLFGRRQYTSLPSATHHNHFYDVDAAKKAKDEKFVAAQEFHDQHKTFLPPLEVGQGVIVQDPHSGVWADEAVISSIRPDGLSYELSSHGRSLLRSRKMLRPLPNFVRFTSPLLPTPLSSASWDPASLLTSPPLTITPNQTGTTLKTSTNLLEPLGSSSTRPPLVEGSPPSSSYASYSWPSGSPSNTIERRTRKPAVQSSTSSCYSQPVITGSTTRIPVPTPRNPHRPSASLQGIPACLLLPPISSRPGTWL